MPIQHRNESSGTGVQKVASRTIPHSTAIKIEELDNDYKTSTKGGVGLHKINTDLLPSEEDDNNSNSHGQFQYLSGKTINRT